jgi:hypothetical protein
MSSSASKRSTLARYLRSQPTSNLLSVALGATSSMVYVHERPSKRRKIDVLRSPPNSGPFAHQNSRTKEAVSEADKQLLNDYDWAIYNILAPKVKAATEEALLKDIIAHQFPSLTQEETAIACFRFLQYGGAHALFLSSWQSRSFEPLRSHGAFFCNQGLLLLPIPQPTETFLGLATASTPSEVNNRPDPSPASHQSNGDEDCQGTEFNAVELAVSESSGLLSFVGAT